MRSFLASRIKSQGGFTLLEVLVVVVVASILAAVAVPNFLAWRSKKLINQATNEARGALVEASRQARRQSKNCSVNLGSSISSSDGCLLSERNLPTSVELATNITGTKLDFSFNGKLSKGGTIVFYDRDIGYKKCLVISEPLAIVREGQYTGSISSIKESDCQSN